MKRVPGPDHEGNDAVGYATIFRQKVAELRAEIAHLSALSQAYRRRGLRDAAGMEADLRRHARLHEIKLELVRLSELGGSVTPGNGSEVPRRPFLVKRPRRSHG